MVVYWNVVFFWIIVSILHFLLWLWTVNIYHCSMFKYKISTWRHIQNNKKTNGSKSCIERSIQRINTWGILKQFLTPDLKKRHTLGLFCLLRTGTVGTKALNTENDVFIPTSGLKPNLRTRNWQFHSRQKVTLPNCFPCPTVQTFKLGTSSLPEDSSHFSALTVLSDEGPHQGWNYHHFYTRYHR